MTANFNHYIRSIRTRDGVHIGDIWADGPRSDRDRMYAFIDHNGVKYLAAHNIAQAKLEARRAFGRLDREWIVGGIRMRSTADHWAVPA